MQGLPTSRVVDVQLFLSALQAQAPTINSLLELGTDTVIDTVERMRTYATLAEVATDFGTSAPEYQAAVLWFGQSPQPEELNVGRWVKTASAGQLIGGGVLAANLLAPAWTGITDGSFRVTLNAGVAAHGYSVGAALTPTEQLIGNFNAISDGTFTVVINSVSHDITGLDFTGAFFLDEVASIIQDALIIALSGTTCVWSGSTFTITSPTTGTGSTVSDLTTQGTGTDVSGTLKMRSGQGTRVAGTAGGSASNITGLNFSSVTNLNGVASVVKTGLIASLAGTNCVYDATYNRFIVTAPGTGTTSNVSFLSAAGSGTDVSGMLAGLSTSSGAYLAPGLAAETAVAAVALFDAMFSTKWYGLVIPDASDADHQAVAAYVEAANPKHYYGITSNESGIIVSGDTSNIPYVLKLLKYDKTAVQYCSTNDYAIMSYLARILTTPWLGQNTTITLKFKTEPGVIAETLNTTQANAAEAKNCNVYVAYNTSNDIAFIEQGVSVSGQFTDTVIGADWLAGNIGIEVFDALQGSETKIPQTDAGMNVLKNAAEVGCIDGVTNGFLAPNKWLGAGFGTLAYGDELSKGYYIYASKMASQSEAVRQTRAAPVMQIAAKTAGAIHSSQVLIYVQQ